MQFASGFPDRLMALIHASPSPIRSEVQIGSMEIGDLALQFITASRVDQHVIGAAETCRTVQLGRQQAVRTGIGFPVPDHEAGPLNIL
jgi:hypothetical protein